MKRLLLILVLLSIPVIADGPGLTPGDVWNDFAITVGEWAQMYNVRQPGGINAKELRMWEEVKRKWPGAKRAIDSTY